MNSAAADFPPALTTKSGVGLKMIPVGSKVTPPVPAGRLTMSGLPAGCGAPAPSYKVELSLWLLATQAGPGPKLMPQGFTRWVSTVTVPLAVSATRFLATNAVAALTVRVTDLALLLPPPP